MNVNDLINKLKSQIQTYYINGKKIPVLNRRILKQLLDQKTFKVLTTGTYMGMKTLRKLCEELNKQYIVVVKKSDTRTIYVFCTDNELNAVTETYGNKITNVLPCLD